MSFPKPKMTDRRKQALGYPGRGVYARRNKSAIRNIVWHYTATTHGGYGGDVIKAHENYWKNTHGWDIGGYHYYIDRAGNIFWNYDLEICTYGASAANPYTMHISVEASAVSNYTPAQIKAREDLTLWLLTNDLKHLTGQSMRGHKEVPGNSTSCPGYSVVQLNKLRADLDAKLKGTAKPKPAPVVKPTSNDYYTVKHGDTLWLVATAHGLTLNQIRELNPTRKNDMLYTGDKLRVKGDVPKIDTPTDGKEQGLKNPKEYPDKGTFEFNQSSAVRNSPRLDNKVVANYNKGEKVNYDRILYGASYTWLSYISYDGTRRYVACGDNGQLYGEFI